MESCWFQNRSVQVPQHCERGFEVYRFSRTGENGAVGLFVFEGSTLLTIPSPSPLYSTTDTDYVTRFIAI